MGDKDYESELLLKAAVAERLALEKELKQLKEESAELQQGSIEEARITFELSQKEQQLRLANLEIQKQQLETAGALSNEQQNSLQQINKQIENERKAAKDYAKAGKEKLKLLEKDEEHNKHIKKLVLGIGESEQKRKIKLQEVLNISKEITKEQAQMALKQKISEISWASLAIVEKGAMSFDRLSTSVNAATNTAGVYNDAIRNVSMSHSRLGITGEDAAKSTIELYQSFSAMSSLSKEAGDDLVDFSAQMEKAGISSQTTAKFLNTATRSMGMGINEVKKYEKELFAFSRANGISMKAINDGLASVMPRLAAFGKDAPKIFKDLAFQAKQMGVEMNKILDVTEKFTTFEGAAEAVGELNSVLGGNYLDSLEMLRAASDDPVKAQEMLRDALQKTGKSFDQLSGQQRRMFASMLGTDMDTAAGFFKKTTAEAKQAAMTQEQFNKAVGAFTAIGDKLKAIMGKLAPAFQFFAYIMGAVVDAFTWLLDLDGVGWFIGVLGGLLALGAAITGIVGAAFSFLLVTLGQLQIAFTALKGNSIAMAIAAKFAGKEIAVGGAQAAAGGAGFTTAGGEVAAGSAAAAGGIASFVGIVTPFLPFLGSIALVILAIGAAFLMMGISIALILAGVIGVVVAIGYLFKILIDGGSASLSAAISFAVLSASLYILAGALGALGTLGTIGIGVLIILTALILSMGISFTLIGEGISKAESGISSLMSFDLTKLDTMKDKLSAIADVVERMGAAATIFSAAMSNPVMLPVMAATVAAAPALQTTAMTIGNTASTTGDSNKQINVTVQIDSPIVLNDRELGRFVENKIIEMDTYGNMLGGMSLSTTNKAPPK